MELDKARQIVQHVVEHKLRWGKHYTADDIGVPVLLEALSVLAQADNERITGQDEALEAKDKEIHDAEVLHNRQLGAAKARETKLKKQLEGKDAEYHGVIEQMKEEFVELQEELAIARENQQTK